MYLVVDEEDSKRGKNADSAKILRVLLSISSFYTMVLIFVL